MMSDECGMINEEGRAASTFITHHSSFITPQTPSLTVGLLPGSVIIRSER